MTLHETLALGAVQSSVQIDLLDFMVQDLATCEECDLREPRSSFNAMTGGIFNFLWMRIQKGHPSAQANRIPVVIGDLPQLEIYLSWRSTSVDLGWRPSPRT